MTELLVGPRLPDFRTLALDLALRARMKRPNRSTHVTAQSLHAGARRFREGVASPKLPPFVKIEATEIGGRPSEWVRASPAGARASDDASPQKVILYFHGGGFFMSSPELHRAMSWRLARAASCPVLAVDYRKAPDHAFPSWVDDAHAAYTHLLNEGYDAANIVFAGDSAGGNIALALAHRIRREKLPSPDALVLFSPWADLLCTGNTFRTKALRDAMFDADSVRALGRFLTRECDPYDPEVSPAYGDYADFPRMIVFAGSTEVFLDDARTVVSRARAAGSDASLYVYRHMPHVFPIFAGLIPRAKEAFERVRKFIAKEPLSAGSA